MKYEYIVILFHLHLIQYVSQITRKYKHFTLSDQM